MATAPVKPHPLHNFTVSLKWGQTTKLASGGGGGSSGSHARPAQPHLSESDAESDREIVSGNLPPSVTNTAVHRSGSRSARQQRSSFSSCSTIFHKPVSEEELRKEVAKKEAGGEDDDEEEEEEIEEDIFILTGSRPARRPKKRAKNVQKLLDNIFPGLWLVGNTVDSYRIAETPMMVRYTYPFFLAQHLYLGR
ncbi:hypothetical protein LINPERHAP1_LOCUS3376 [Linum perenne]